MPIYNYECDLCYHAFEELQSVNDDPLTICPQCHELGLKKVPSKINFRLDGSGFYGTGSGKLK